MLDYLLMVVLYLTLCLWQVVCLYCRVLVMFCRLGHLVIGRNGHVFVLGSGSSLSAAADLPLCVASGDSVSCLDGCGVVALAVGNV